MSLALISFTELKPIVRPVDANTAAASPRVPAARALNVALMLYGEEEVEEYPTAASRSERKLSACTVPVVGSFFPSTDTTVHGMPPLKVWWV